MHHPGKSSLLLLEDLRGPPQAFKQVLLSTALATIFLLSSTKQPSRYSWRGLPRKHVRQHFTASRITESHKPRPRHQVSQEVPGHGFSLETPHFPKWRNRHHPLVSQEKAHVSLPALSTSHAILPGPPEFTDSPFLPQCSHLLSLKHITKRTHESLLTHPYPLSFLPHDSQSSQCTLSSRNHPCGSVISAPPCRPSSAWSNASWGWVCPPDFATGSEPAGIPGALHQERKNVPPRPKLHFVNGPPEQGCLGPQGGPDYMVFLLTA